VTTVARDQRTPSAVASGRTAGVLYAACGLYTLVTVILPTPPGFRDLGVLAIGLVAVVSGVAAWFVPWDRVPTAARLGLGPAAMVLILVHNVLSGMDQLRYGMFFFMIFIWLGLCERRWWSLKMSPLILLAYVTPLVLTGASTSDIYSFSYSVPLYVTVGEVLAWRTERLRQLQDRLRYLADHDALTGLSNRAVFDRDLRHATTSGAELAVVFVDLDGFKQINDEHGHQAGDEVLARVAEMLRASARIQRGDRPYRLAGDEFVVLLTGPGAQRSARMVADRFIERLGAVPVFEGGPVRASVGVAGGASVDGRAIVKAADDAMYAAKRAGSGLVSVTVP
jgi:diguanylate cyclase (GGDEF)-like protein